MSRAILIALFLHVLAISFVWIGFATPLPREGVVFYYTGSAMPVEAPPSKHKPLPFKTPESASFPLWMEIRDLNKPRSR
jgi:hypothetical protein